MAAPINPAGMSPTLGALPRPVAPGHQGGTPSSERKGAPSADAYDGNPRLSSALRALAARAAALRAGAAEAQALDEGLGSVSERLAEILELARAGSVSKGTGSLADSIRAIESIAESIHAIPEDLPTPEFRAIGFRIESDWFRYVESATGRAKVPLEEPFDVDVEILDPLEHAALELDFRKQSLDLAPESQFVIDVAGPSGVATLTFVSGTTIADMATAINARADATGVLAFAHQGELSFYSSEPGSGQFVSVEIVNDGGIEQTASANEIYGFDSLGWVRTGATFTDQGQDVLAKINGRIAESNGRTISISTPEYDLSITLSSLAANREREFHAFRIVPTGIGDAVAGPPVSSEPIQPPGTVGAAAELRSLARELRENAPTLTAPDVARNAAWIALKRAALSHDRAAAATSIDNAFAELVRDHAGTTILELFPHDNRPRTIDAKEILSRIRVDPAETPKLSGPKSQI